MQRDQADVRPTDPTIAGSNTNPFLRWKRRLGHVLEPETGEIAPECSQTSAAEHLGQRIPRYAVAELQRFQSVAPVSHRTREYLPRISVNYPTNIAFRAERACGYRCPVAARRFRGMAREARGDAPLVERAPRHRSVPTSTATTWHRNIIRTRICGIAVRWSRVFRRQRVCYALRITTFCITERFTRLLA